MALRIANIDFTITLLRCLLWQYDNAPNLRQLLQYEQDFSDANIAGFWQNWYDNIFNIDTAGTFGLEVWGLIMGLRRPYQEPENYHVNQLKQFELYDETTRLWHTIWLSGSAPALRIQTEGQILDSRTFVDDDTYRLFLKAQMFLFNSNGSMKDINTYLDMLFEGKPVFAINNLNMSVTVVFYYQPSSRDLGLINSPEFLPLPAGVDSDVIIASTDGTFGFDGQELSTWGDWNTDAEIPNPIPRGYGTFFR